MSRVEIHMNDWSTEGDSHIFDTGIDLAIQTTKASFLYEDRCFEVLTGLLVTGEFAFGPHLVDAVIGRNDGWQRRVRPDAIIFRCFENTWMLYGLAEFKSGRQLGTKRKLEGFSELLEKLRLRPEFLPTEVNRILGDIIEMPSHIIIPPDSGITVMYMGQYNKSLMQQNNTDFLLHYLRVDADNDIIH